jgi:hypothetical protein
VDGVVTSRETPKKAGRLHAKQIRGMPDYPVQALYPTYLHPHGYVSWALWAQGLTQGVRAKSDGFISYAPVMLTKKKARYAKFRVDVFDEEAAYRARLVYSAQDGKLYEQIVPIVRPAFQDEVAFELPEEHMAGNWWFSCALHFQLLTPIPEGSERKVAVADGLENPCMPILICGAHLESVE